MRWHVYECEGEHKVIVECDSDVTTVTFVCPICDPKLGNLAVYNDSAKTLTEIQEKMKDG